MTVVVKQEQLERPPITRNGYGRWVYGLVTVPPIAAVLTLLLAPEPRGHWSEHLLSAYFDAAVLLVLIVLAGLVGWRKLSVLLWVSFAVITVGIAFQVIGNFQVADSIWGTGGNPGYGDGYGEGHDLVMTGDLLVMVGGAAFALIAGIGRRVPVGVAGVALVMVVIPPPFLWPAAGVLMLLLYGVRSAAQFAGRERSNLGLKNFYSKSSIDRTSLSQRPPPG